MSIWTDALGAEVNFIDAGGWRTRTIQMGEGQPVICMGGLSGHLEGFVKILKPLSSAGYRVIAIDAIGHGLTDKPTNVTYHSPLFVEHLKRSMNEMGIEKAHLIGQSLGGWTAMDFALAYPERILSLISLTGAGLLLNNAEDQKRSDKVHQAVSKVTSKAADNPTREKVRERLEWLMHKKDLVTEELVECRYTFFTRPGEEQGLKKLVNEQPGPENIAAHAITEDKMRALGCPVAIFWTEFNPTTPASVGEAAAKIIPNCQYDLILDAGHWPMWEQPEATSDKIIGFLEGLK